MILGPKLEEVLTNNRITAWICINDSVAISVLRLLIIKGIKVPERIALISFDNSQAAYAFGLSSYDFRWDAVGRATVNSLVNKNTRQRSLRPVRIKGYIFPRSTA